MVHRMRDPSEVEENGALWTSESETTVRSLTAAFRRCGRTAYSVALAIVMRRKTSVPSHTAQRAREMWRVKCGVSPLRGGGV